MLHQMNTGEVPRTKLMHQGGAEKGGHGWGPSPNLRLSKGYANQ